MKKLSKKLLAVLLVIAMLVPTGALMVNTSAEDTSYNVGDIIEFGSYPQDEVTDSTYVGKTTTFNGKTYSVEPLEWRVLKVENGKALLLTEEVIDNKCYNSTSATVDGYYGNNYAHSDIREWLINDFYNTAFSNAEKNCMVATTLDNSAAPTDINTSGSYTKYSSEPTTDNVFLLSKDEANTYASKYFRTTATDYAISLGYQLYSGAGSVVGDNWTLRTAGNNTYQIYTVHVRWGEHVTYFNWYDDTITTPRGVRPAIYLDLDAYASEGDDGFDENGGFTPSTPSDTSEFCLIITINSGGYVSDFSVKFSGPIVFGMEIDIWNIQNAYLADGETINISLKDNMGDFWSEMLPEIILKHDNGFSFEGGENISYTWDVGYAEVGDDSEGDASGPQFPAGYDPLLDKYGFTNPSQVVESKIYKTVYGTVKGVWLSFIHENNKAHGLCYGMASTTAALLQNRTAIKSFSLLSPEMNLGNVEFITNIYDSSYSSCFNMSVLDFIKYGYVYQFATDRDSTINNLRNLYSSINANINGRGSAVVISIWHGTKNNRKHGHAILATGIKETNNEYIIMIDDSNFFEQTELSISKDFSSWSYSVDNTFLSDGSAYNYNSSNGIIGYDIPGSVVYQLGILAGKKAKSSMNYLNDNKLLVSSTSSLIENANLSEIFVTEKTDSDTNKLTKLYWIDEDIHAIELSAKENNSEITISDINSSVSVILDSNEHASFYVDDNTTNKVSYTSEKNKNANISFTSVDDAGEILTTTLTGTTNGDEVTATETEDGIQVTGLNDITVTYETPDGTAETKANVNDGSTVNITLNDDENTVKTDWTCKHFDENHDGICDACSEDFTKSCSCSCHGNSFIQFLFKIITFLRKLFGMEQYHYCDCGKAHW